MTDRTPRTKNFVVSLVGKVGLMVLITLLLLEGTTRLVWWNKSSVALFGKQVTLLPWPILSQEQQETLAHWAEDDNRYVQFDSILGWSHAPNVHEVQDGVSYTTNSSGARALREYDLQPPPGVLRLAAFGPSFTHGDEVSDEQAWTAQMEQMRPELEVMNWGVGGYGTDQAFLRYQTQGQQYQPHVVIIGFEEENLFRNVNRFRPFYRSGTGLPLTKPVFVLDADTITFLDNPFNSFDDFYTMVINQPDQFLQQVCPQDFFCDEALYQPHRLDTLATYRLFRTLIFEMGGGPQIETDEAYPVAVTLAVIQRFLEEIVQNGAIPIVLIFPEQTTLSDYEAGNLPSYQAGIVTLRDRGVPVIDLAGALTEAKRSQNLDFQDFYASEGGHFNALGNQVVAQTIIWHLCGEGLLTGC